jgi:hypothetical protein
VIYTRIEPKTDAASLWPAGLDGKVRRCLVRAGEREPVDTFCISPDGRHLGVVFVAEVPSEKGQRPSRTWELSVLDSDGTHRRPMPLVPLRFDVLDWHPVGP